MIERCLILLQDHLTLNPQQQDKWRERLTQEKDVLVVKHLGEGVGCIAYEPWTYNLETISMELIVACEPQPDALSACQSELLRFMHANPHIQKWNTIIGSNRKDIQTMFESLGFTMWYDYVAMDDFETTNLTSSHTLTVRNIVPEDFEVYFKTMGLCFEDMRRSVDIRPHNVIDQLWSDDAKKQTSYQEWIDYQDNTWMYFDGITWVGTGLIVHDRDIDDVFVPKDVQGKGYGQAIIIDLIQKIQARGHVPSIGHVGVNAHAGRLYESCGFKVTKRTHHMRMFTKI